MNVPRALTLGLLPSATCALTSWHNYWSHSAWPACWSARTIQSAAESMPCEGLLTAAHHCSEEQRSLDGITVAPPAHEGILEMSTREPLYTAGTIGICESVLCTAEVSQHIASQFQKGVVMMLRRCWSQKRLSHRKVGDLRVQGGHRWWSGELDQIGKAHITW